MAKRIFVVGHRGMVGRALMRHLEARGETGVFGCSHEKLDLTNQSAVQDFFQKEQIDEVYFAAAKVGGIHANSTYPAEFIHENLLMAANTIHAAHLADIQKFMFLGSSCIYPRLAPQPIREEALMTGPLEPTNEPYAIAKIAGIKLCESYNRQYGRDYRSAMPTNLYGSYDNFHPENSHVVPALIRRFHAAVKADAPEIVIWGSGTPMREFMYVDDMASACVHLMDLPLDVLAQESAPMRSHINIGTGKDCTIRELAETLSEVSGFNGKLVFDRTKPDGMPRKLLDISRLKRLGWKPDIGLRDGLGLAYDWFLQNSDRFRGQDL